MGWAFQKLTSNWAFLKFRESHAFMIRLIGKTDRGIARVVEKISQGIRIEYNRVTNSWSGNTTEVQQERFSGNCKYEKEKDLQKKTIH